MNRRLPVASMVFALGCAAVGAATYPENAVAPVPNRWMLAYPGDSGRRAYSVDDFLRLVAAVDTNGHPVSWLSNGVLFATIRTPTGHHYASWLGEPYATGADWEGYVNTLFGAQGSLARLDSAVSLAAGTLGPAPGRFKVAVVVLYPEEKSDSMTFMGTTYHFKDAAGRAAATRAYINAVSARFDSAHYQSVHLTAFYWLHESIHGDEEQVVPLVAQTVHAAKKRFMWVPYYTAWGVPNWRKFGFDETWIQPNYFFNLDLQRGRLDSAVVKARDLDMGLEMEFDGRSYAKPEYFDRLDAYLATLNSAGDLKRRDVLTYEGGGALITLSKSKVPRERDLYRRFVATIGYGPPSSVSQ